MVIVIVVVIVLVTAAVVVSSDGGGGGDVDADACSGGGSYLEHHSTPCTVTLCSSSRTVDVYATRHKQVDGRVLR